MNKSYAKQLDMVYTYDNGILTFTDKTEYTIREVLQLTTATCEEIRAIHKVKGIFDGELVSTPDDSEEWQVQINESLIYRDIVPRELQYNHELDFLANRFSNVEICGSKDVRPCADKEEWRKGDITDKELAEGLFTF